MLYAENIDKETARELVEQMALLVSLQLRDEYKDGVVANFERIIAIADIVNSFHLPENVEAGCIFEPSFEP
jgi:Asp-tRNA(Asn)/Glu-tRNA(Gln) amidotransferase C subunit